MKTIPLQKTGRLGKGAPVQRPLHYVVWQSMPGGMESYISHYAERFSPYRETFLFSLRPTGNHLTGQSDEYYQEGDDNNWRCFPKYFRYCRANRGDVFHIMNSGPIILLITLLAGATHVIYHIHGTKHWRSWKTWLFRKPLWMLAGLFKVRFIANSEHSARIFREEVMPVPLRMIYNGFELADFLEKRRLRSGLRRMAYIGRLSAGKNAHLVVRLFEEIAQDMPELELHIAGEGDVESEIEKQARQSPYSDRIFLHGWVEDIAAFYQAADLFVFPSAHESFGNVVAEALLTGLPILTSSVPVFEEIYGDEPLFNLGDPENYPAFRDNFLKAVQQYPLLAQKAWHSAGRISGLFNLETHLQKIESAYEGF